MLRSIDLSDDEECSSLPESPRLCGWTAELNVQLSDAVGESFLAT